MAEPFRHRLRVRYRECDGQGIVFNANYLAYLDDALTELFRAVFGSYEAVTAHGIDVVVAHADLRFLASGHFDDELDVEVAVAALGTTSMTLSESITRVGDSVRLAEATLRYVWLDVAGDRGSTPMPDWVRAGLAGYVAVPAAPA